MKINDDHLYHGAALTQVAEHPTFKAINAFLQNGAKSRSAFLVNHDIGLFLKYATKPRKPFDEFVFTFQPQHFEELDALCKKTANLFLALVCVDDRQICCVPYEMFLQLIQKRKDAKGASEPAYTVLVTIPPGKGFRVYMNVPGHRKKKLGERIIARDEFPRRLFE